MQAASASEDAESVHHGLSTHPLAAKSLAAAAGSTLTVLTMTPFDVIKTRLQTQPHPVSTSNVSVTKALETPFGRGSSLASSSAACCQGPVSQCVRNYTTASLSYPTSRSLFTQTMDFRTNVRVATDEVVCLWDHGVPRVERVSGFWDAASKIIRVEGLSGLWKGAGTTLVIAIPAQSAYMVTYENLKNSGLISSHAGVLAPLIAGISARTMVSSVSSPMELLRTRLQSTPVDPNVPHTFQSVMSGIKQMVRNEGPISLWRGLGPTLWRDVPFSGIYWIGFETIKGKLKDYGLTGPLAAFISGATSGTTAALLTSPFDVLKTRRQALANSALSPGSGRIVTSTFPLLMQIVKTEGPKALFAGLTPRMVKIAPACGIMISCYEGVGRLLGANS